MSGMSSLGISATKTGPANCRLNKILGTLHLRTTVWRTMGAPFKLTHHPQQLTLKVQARRKQQKKTRYQ